MAHGGRGGVGSAAAAAAAASRRKHAGWDFPAEAVHADRPAFVGRQVSGVLGVLQLCRTCGHAGEGSECKPSLHHQPDCTI